MEIEFARSGDDADAFVVRLVDAASGWSAPIGSTWVVPNSRGTGFTGSKSRPRFRKGGQIWRVDPEPSTLDERERNLVRRKNKRDKTSREAAGAYLVELYRAAGVALPEPPSAAAA